jgi:hypothetical protein
VVVGEGKAATEVASGGVVGIGHREVAGGYSRQRHSSESSDAIDDSPETMQDSLGRGDKKTSPTLQSNPTPTRLHIIEGQRGTE